MLSKEEKLEVLKEVLDSYDFNASETLKKLLTYLVKSTVDDVLIKEYSIATEVFDKGSDFNPAEDASIRVYISNIRKKLDDYYNREGNQSKYRMRIPRGKYVVEFSSVSRKKITKIFETNRIHILIYILISAAAGLYVIYKDSSPDKISQAFRNDIENSFWSDILISERPVDIVISDDLFFIEDPNIKPANLENIYSEEFIVRKHDINTPQEFTKYKTTHNDPFRTIKEITTYPFFPLQSVYSLPHIISLF